MLFLWFQCLVILPPTKAYGQCAMCRATVENNISKGKKIGSGLNAGIVYLASVPYVLLTTLGILWYRNAKKKRKYKKNA
ncbi:MAG: hypothetical protein EAZ55_04750 [Cytophagales bacterium]|nr:MAG: hypothetical protein EAZ55_04750 [Cytophagales bacterium]